MTMPPDLTFRQTPIPFRVLFAFFFAITLFGKGPTYLGLPPLYWAEFALGINILWMGMRSSRLNLRPMTDDKLISVLILLFILQGSFQLLIDLMDGRGIKAMRDSAIWYYAVFYFVGVRLARHPRTSDIFWKYIQMAWFLSPLWTSFYYTIYQKLVQISPKIFAPRLPGAQMGIFDNSGSEIVQHSFMGAILILLLPSIPRLVKWPLVQFLLSTWGMFLTIVAQGRGVKVAAGLSLILGIIVTFNKKKYLWPSSRLVWFFYFNLIALLFIFSVKSPEFAYQYSRLERFSQISETQGTANWRRVWWQNIHNEVSEKAPFFGLGFGFSLSIYNPWILSYQKNIETIRSPHGIWMTILGRMGHVGLLVWLLIIIIGMGNLVRMATTGKNRKEAFEIPRHKEIVFWLIFLSCTLINASFGVLMEGPVFGTWFWFGLGYATARGKLFTPTYPVRATYPRP